MTCADIFKAYGDLMVDSIDPLVSTGIHFKISSINYKVSENIFLSTSASTVNAVVSKGFTR